MTENEQTPYDDETLLAMARDVTKRTFDYRDEFNRRPIAENIIKLLDPDIEVSPMVIDGGWGTGKTEFCWKLINLMREEDTHPVMHINAFQADHANEPLLTVLAEIIKAIPEEEKEKKELIDKALKVAGFGLKIVGKGLLASLFRQNPDDMINGFNAAAQDEANKAVEASVESLLKDHEKADANLKSLQEALETIAKKKPMVLFIDELDRCKPDFAIHMLEVIKHVFDVEGIQFVLVCNTQQLEASIKHCYGGAVDAQDYLNKFLKFTFTLPKHCIGINEQTDASIRYYGILIKKSSIIEPVLSTEYNDFIFDFIQHMIKAQNLSLRKIETFVRHLEIYQKLMNKENPEKNNGIGKGIKDNYSLLRLTGILLFCLKPELATAMLDNRLDSKKLGDFFGENFVPSETPNLYLKPHQIILAILANECQQSNGLRLPDRAELDKLIERFDPYREIASSHPSKRPYSDIVINAIKALNLSNT